MVARHRKTRVQGHTWWQIIILLLRTLHPRRVRIGAYDGNEKEEDAMDARKKKLRYLSQIVPRSFLQNLAIAYPGHR